MGLDEFYKLRKNFIVLGLTGKMQSGANDVINLLTQKSFYTQQQEFLNDFQITYKKISDSESRKIGKIKDFFSYDDNWIQFDVIDYRNVILLFLLSHNYDKNSVAFAENISNWIIRLGNYKDFETPRFGGKIGIAKDSTEFLKNDFLSYLRKTIPSIDLNFEEDTLYDTIKKNSREDFFFDESFQKFCEEFFEKLDSFSPYLRHKLNHVIAYCLRRFGCLDIEKIKNDSEDHIDEFNHIYIIADVINVLIKNHRKNIENKGKVAHIIIDRLKNSYELMYFREKYAGFYMVSTSREEKERKNYIKAKNSNKEYKTNKEENLRLIYKLDEIEYKVEDFKKGVFDGYDVENCVQKSDYHIVCKDRYELDEKSELNKIIAFYRDGFKENNLDKTNKFYVYQPTIIQILKLIALIQQPGLITPNYIERIMQIAYNAKLNSGCISRQVGAVVTDSHFSVKGIGWNDVPLGQTPCSIRDIRDLINNPDSEGFSEYERGNTNHTYKDGKKFSEKIKEDFEKASKNEKLNKNLKGRPCSFCFKSFHNSYENKTNQVHTRSLHAEENAMLQISKYGGQPLYGGNLFTTASPCELCSKKAFQLGIKNIFYIDLYPGISKNHILEGGRSKEKNPKLYQFQGVIGKSYQKLYEPFMAIKDETILRSKIKPTKTS